MKKDRYRMENGFLMMIYLKSGFQREKYKGENIWYNSLTEK